MAFQQSLHLSSDYSSRHLTVIISNSFPECPVKAVGDICEDSFEFRMSKEDLLSLNTEVRGDLETRRFYERFAICDLGSRFEGNVRMSKCNRKYLNIKINHKS